MHVIKDYLEYRRNRRIMKRMVAEIGATLLPSTRQLMYSLSDIEDFFIKLVHASKDIEGEELIRMVIDEVAAKLEVDSPRLVEVLSYIATLSPQDIQKIINTATIDTFKQQ